MACLRSQHSLTPFLAWVPLDSDLGMEVWCAMHGLCVTTAQFDTLSLGFVQVYCCCDSHIALINLLLNLRGILQILFLMNVSRYVLVAIVLCSGVG